jgi:Kef-type K+ transport system membrane component KefB
MKWFRHALFILFLIALPHVALAAEAAPAETITHRMTVLVMELAVIILMAKASGYVFSRYLRQPAVLGELCAGMLIGPYALGGLNLPLVGQLFSLPHGMLPVSPELYGIATIASIVLLFLAGIETDLSMFLRYSAAGTVVGIGGVVGSFFLGALLAVWFGIADGFMDPAALFLGAISTATSVGITARILSEKRKLDSPEGVTILSAAVIDDVLGIVILAIVVGIAKISGGAGVNWFRIGIIAAKALSFWIISTLLGLILARRISDFLKWFQSPELIASLALGLALFLAGLSEMAGLAMIIGAYIMGLALSRTDVKHELHEQLQGVYQFLVPIFFCVMGMLVDFRAMKGALLFGAVYSAVAVAAKIIGCAIPALAMHFTPRGAIRVGIGMLPRGEVALIIAGIGMATHIITPEVFGVAIMMTLITTVIAPPLLVRVFEGPAGITKEAIHRPITREEKIQLEFPNAEIAEFVLARLAQAFRGEAFFVHRINPGMPIYQLRREEVALTLLQEENRLVVESPPQHADIARFIVAEEMLELGLMFESLKKMSGALEIGQHLISDTFRTK